MASDEDVHELSIPAPPSSPLPRVRVAQRYGSTEYRRFKCFEALSVGGKALGKVDVDCTLRLAQSQCGVLGRDARPACIMFMDLSFRQPADCRLERATVVITLEDHPEPAHMDFYGNEQSDLSMTNSYGPWPLCGPMKKKANTNEVHMTPFVEVMNFGVGGMGRVKSKVSLEERRWSFAGGLVRPDSHAECSMRGGAYRTLRWDLEENSWERQSQHQRTFNTAFAFEHGINPFVLTVDVSGKLQRKRDRFRHCSFPRKQDDGLTRTLVDLTEHYPYQPRNRRQLDYLADRIPLEMTRINKANHPVEISDGSKAPLQDTHNVETEEPAADEVFQERLEGSGALATSVEQLEHLRNVGLRLIGGPADSQNDQVPERDETKTYAAGPGQNAVVGTSDDKEILLQPDPSSDSTYLQTKHDLNIAPRDRLSILAPFSLLWHLILDQSSSVQYMMASVFLMIRLQLPLGQATGALDKNFSSPDPNKEATISTNNAPRIVEPGRPLTPSSPKDELHWRRTRQATVTEVDDDPEEEAPQQSQRLQPPSPRETYTQSLRSPPLSTEQSSPSSSTLFPSPNSPSSSTRFSRSSSTTTIKPERTHSPSPIGTDSFSNPSSKAKQQQLIRRQRSPSRSSAATRSSTSQRSHTRVRHARVGPVRDVRIRTTRRVGAFSPQRGAMPGTRSRARAPGYF